jgi:hypothetical protein
MRREGRSTHLITHLVAASAASLDRFPLLKRTRPYWIDGIASTRRWPRRLRRLPRFDEAGGTRHDYGRRITARAILFQFFHLCRQIGIRALFPRSILPPSARSPFPGHHVEGGSLAELTKTKRTTGATDGPKSPKGFSLAIA